MPEVNPTALNTPEENARRAEEAKTARATAQADAVKKLDEDEKARVDAMKVAAERQAKSKPTPTQRENDLAKLGLLNIDEKEDDGSGPENATHMSRAIEPGNPARYKTRDAQK